jgi:hypothetical protein
MKTDDKLQSNCRTDFHFHLYLCQISRFDTLTGQILLVSEKDVIYDEWTYPVLHLSVRLTTSTRFT